MAKVQAGTEHAPTSNGTSRRDAPQPEPTDRAIPKEVDAERGLIGAALLSYPALTTLAERVTPQQFYDVAHQQIAGALVTVYEQGDKADPITVHARLLAATGSNVTLNDLLALQGANYVASNAGRYADLILAAHQRRELIAAASHLTEAAYEGADPSRPLARLKLVAETLERTSAEPLTVRWVEDAIKSPPPQPPTLVEGLIRAGELVVAGAPRAIGKSWFAMNLAVLLGRGEGRFLGTLDVVEQARVLIAQGELDEAGTSDRWRMLTGDEGLPTGVAETFDRWRLRIVQRTSVRDGATDRWYDAVLDGRLEQTIVDHKFRVLIIDPWAVYFAGSENSNDEAEAALDKLRDLAMRHGIAVVIIHHLGKATEARDPEDLWRGASRLADWASTRVTMLEHYTAKQAKAMGMSRRQARRYIDVHFLRRSAPTEDFSIVLNPQSGWWERWCPPEEMAEAQQVNLDPSDVQDACRLSGGSWPSVRAAADALGVAPATAKRLLAKAVMHGVLEEFTAARNATGYRLPVARLTDYSDEALFAEDDEPPEELEPPSA